LKWDGFRSLVCLAFGGWDYFLLADDTQGTVKVLFTYITHRAGVR